MEGDTVKVASRFDFTLIGLDGLDASQPTALKFPSPLSSGKALDQLELSDLVPVCLDPMIICSHAARSRQESVELTRSLKRQFW